MKAFQAISSPRLYRVIANQISEKIIAGEFSAGERLPSERELAQMFEVSRASIREAIIALEIEGYVEVRMGSGIFVLSPPTQRTPLTSHLERLDALADPPTDISPFELLEARLLIEPEIAALTAKTATIEQIETIEKSYHALAECPYPSATHDRDFHISIANASGNPTLQILLAHLWHLTELSLVSARFDKHFVTESVWASAIVEHEIILDAIKDHDQKRARYSMYAHLAGVATRLRQEIQ